MKKIIVLGFFIFICFLFIQCDELSSTGSVNVHLDNDPNDVGGSNTVTPNAPPANNARGFQPDTGSEVYSAEDQIDDTNNHQNDNALYKSDRIREREGRWGVSAPVMHFNSSVFEDFRLGRTFRSRDIKNMRIYVDMEKAGTGAYYQGKVTLSYNDSGARRVPYTQFYSGDGDNARYNVWFNKNGTRAFHGFFQENEGALILVVDRQTSVLQSPDDSNAVNQDNLRGGSIWTMMFRTTFRGATSCTNHSQSYISEYNKYLYQFEEKLPLVSQLSVKCWFKTMGPYDCRTWRSDNGVDTFKAIEPNDNCYAKLGDFEGLDITEAFNVRDFNNLVIQ